MVRRAPAEAAGAGGQVARRESPAGGQVAAMREETLADVDAGEGAGSAGQSGTEATGGTPAVTAASDGGSMARQAAPACGSDLDVRNGTVALALGELPPAAAFSSAPADNGAFAFSTQAIEVELREESFAGAGLQIKLSVGRIAGRAWLPQDSNAHELVLVLPGFATSYTSYTAYAEHLASHGFVVVGIDTRSNLLMSSHDTEALEVVRTLDWLLQDSPFKQRIDASKIAVAGHSKGGKVAFFASALDPRIDLVIGWDPVNGGGGPCAFDPNCNAMPVAPNCAVMAQGIEQYMHAESLVIGAPPDPDLNPEASQNCVEFYRGAPSPAALIVLATGHAAWAQGADAPDVFRITKAAHLARLLQRFRNATGLDDYLPNSAKLAADALVQQQALK
jgi:dienelactone hydrolase